MQLSDADYGQIMKECKGYSDKVELVIDTLEMFDVIERSFRELGSGHSIPPEQAKLLTFTWYDNSGEPIFLSIARQIMGSKPDGFERYQNLIPPHDPSHTHVPNREVQYARIRALFENAGSPDLLSEDQLRKMAADEWQTFQDAVEWAKDAMKDGR